jgi:hypothetical protein
MNNNINREVWIAAGIMLIVALVLLGLIFFLVTP